MANYRSGVAQGPMADLTSPLALYNGAGAYDYNAPDQSTGSGGCVSDDFNWIMVGQDWSQWSYDYLYNFADDPISPQQPLGRRYYMIYNEPDRTEAFVTPQNLVTNASGLMSQLRSKDPNCYFMGFNISQNANGTWTSHSGNPFAPGGISGSQRYMWDVLAYWRDAGVGPCRIWRPTFHAYGYSDDPVQAARDIRDICIAWKGFWGTYGPQFADILPEYQDRPIITEIGSNPDPDPSHSHSSTWYNTFFNELYNWLSSTGVQSPVPIAGWAWYNCHPYGSLFNTSLHDPVVGINPAGAQYKIFADRW